MCPNRVGDRVPCQRRRRRVSPSPVNPSTGALPGRIMAHHCPGSATKPSRSGARAGHPVHVGSSGYAEPLREAPRLSGGAPRTSATSVVVSTLFHSSWGSLPRPGHETGQSQQCPCQPPSVSCRSGIFFVLGFEQSNGVEAFARVRGWSRRAIHYSDAKSPFHQAVAPHPPAENCGPTLYTK